MLLQTRLRGEMNLLNKLFKFDLDKLLISNEFKMWDLFVWAVEDGRAGEYVEINAGNGEDYLKYLRWLKYESEN